MEYKKYYVHGTIVERINGFCLNYKFCVRGDGVIVYISSDCKLNEHQIVKEINKDISLAASSYIDLKCKIRNTLEKKSNSKIQIKYDDYGIISNICSSSITAYGGGNFAISNNNMHYTPSLGIDRVIVNGPATIIFWKDKTKTVVKQQKKDKWDLEKAITMCIVKKMLGNKGNYYNCIRKAIELYHKGEVENDSKSNA